MIVENRGYEKAYKELREQIIIEICTNYFNKFLVSELREKTDRELLDILLQLIYEYARA
jgi:hypothetical protein